MNADDDVDFDLNVNDEEVVSSWSLEDQLAKCKDDLSQVRDALARVSKARDFLKKGVDHVATHYPCPEDCCTNDLCAGCYALLILRKVSQ